VVEVVICSVILERKTATGKSLTLEVVTFVVIMRLHVVVIMFQSGDQHAVVGSLDDRLRKTS